MLSIKKLRVIFREHLFGGGAKAAYKKSEYKRLIKSHVKTLKKFLNAFPVYYKNFHGEDWPHKTIKVRHIYEYFIDNEEITIKNFVAYFKGKTGLSYEINCKPYPLKTDYKSAKEYKEYLKYRDEEKAAKNKLGEFVIVILSEYIVLHNWIWSSGLKTKEIKSIDDFLVDFE